MQAAPMVPIQTLRLSPAEKQHLLETIARNRPAVVPSSNRRGLRVDFHPEAPTFLRHCERQASPVLYQVLPRNLSTHGVALLHGQFIYPQTQVELLLPRRAGGHQRARGAILNCTLVQGHVHEIRVLLEAPMEVSQFVALTGTDLEQAQSEYHHAQSALGQTQAQRHPLAGKRMMLAVQDAATIRQIAYWSQQVGMTVHHITQAGGLIREVGLQQPDLVCYEHQLGGIGSLSLAAQMRQTGYRGPLLLVMERADADLEARALAAGLARPLVRPFDQTTWLGAAQQALGITAPEDALPLVSAYAQDPDMLPLVEAFVTSLGTQAEHLLAASQAHDWRTAARLCLDLKGSGGSFGFDAITHEAAQTLALLQATQMEMAQVHEAIQHLTLTLRRATAR